MTADHGEGGDRMSLQDHGRSFLLGWWSRVRPLLSSKRYLGDLLASGSLLFFLVRVVYLEWLRQYLAALPPNPIPDRILELAGPYDLDFFVSTYIVLMGTLLVLHVVLTCPERLPFYLKVYSLLYALKFAGLPTTALTAPADAIFDTFDPIENDLFFSGHTAFMFLSFLLVRRSSRPLSWLFLASTFLEAACVLLMHMHYTIDVYAAPFFAYGAYRIAFLLFGRNAAAYEALRTARGGG